MLLCCDWVSCKGCVKHLLASFCFGTGCLKYSVGPFYGFCRPVILLYKGLSGVCSKSEGFAPAFVWPAGP